MTMRTGESAVAAPTDPMPGEPALLDGLAIGIVLLDGRGALRRANAQARWALDEGRAGLVRSDGTVRPTAVGHDAAWAAALAGAAAGRSCTLRLAPHAGDVAVSPAPPSCGEGAVLCVLPADAACASAAYARAHALSHGETAVLRGLVGGAPPKTLARERGTTEGTVRSQVKSILQKTGQRGMRELVVDVLRSGALHVPPGQGMPAGRS
jgi:DNA-binding CsgD family transcriptional regulator